MGKKQGDGGEAAVEDEEKREDGTECVRMNTHTSLSKVHHNGRME